MGFYELILIALGLSMDAFAVSVCKGLSMKKMNYSKAVVISCFFGGFQAIMPLLGYFLGTSFSEYIVAIDHWLAFGLLSIIGISMVKESNEACPAPDPTFNLKSILALSLATSIDALAVGITFAFLNVNIVPAVTLVGVITFAISFAGVKIGNAFGSKFKSKAELLGGLILIVIGIKILLEHLGVINI